MIEHRTLLFLSMELEIYEIHLYGGGWKDAPLKNFYNSKTIWNRAYNFRSKHLLEIWILLKNNIQVWETIPVKWRLFSRQHIYNRFSKFSVTFACFRKQMISRHGDVNWPHIDTRTWPYPTLIYGDTLREKFTLINQTQSLN